MADENDCWVFDSVIGFIRGPMWTVPVLTFLEEKSLVFDPSVETEEEYVKIFEDYKKLVGLLLSSYTEDIGITDVQFENACSKTSSDTRPEYIESLLEQVWAAEDFEIFRRMMMQKNIELQLQALELLQQRYGLIPDSFLPDDHLVRHYSQNKEEEEIMDEILRQSREEFEVRQNTLKDIDKEMELAMSISSKDRRRLEEERKIEHELLEKALLMTLDDSGSRKDGLKVRPSTPYVNPTDAKKTPTAPSQTPIKMKPSGKRVKYQSQSSTEVDNSRFANRTNFLAKNEMPKDVSEDELQRRQEYLRQQRDQLLKMKRHAREKQLKTYEQSQAKQRPKSSHMARRMLEHQAPDQELDEKTLAMRHALAERLKKEVIGIIY